MTRNTGLAFNLATTDFFELFHAGMLTFLFAMIYCSIREYQSRVKVIRPFDGKITQSVYCLCITIYNYSYTNIDDKYIYIDPPAVI